MKTFSIVFLVVLFISALAYGQQQFIVSWNDPNTVSVDHYTVYRSSTDQDSNLTVVATTVDTFWVDNTIQDDQRYWYRVSATRGYLESNKSNWVSGRSIDLSDSTFVYAPLYEYKQDGAVMLLVWPPADDCSIQYWEYMVPDLVNVRCDSEVIPIPSILKIE